jgi:hypothetical protein
MKTIDLFRRNLANETLAFLCPNEANTEILKITLGKMQDRQKGGTFLSFMYTTPPIQLSDKTLLGM